jgi:MoaA/NifB/PqqE/SkfB family radical SAM enzyme
MEEDREGRRVVNGALTPDHVRSILVAHRCASELCFTSGEPTLVPELLQYAAWARELGVAHVSLSTNGRRLCYFDFCEQLVQAGFDRFYVSIHGHTAKLHDGLVRTPGAFDQSVAGLQNLARLKARGITVHSSTVLTRRTLPHLPDLFGFLRERGADQVVLNAVQPNGRAHTHFDAIVPRYSETVAAFSALLDAIGQPSPPVFLVDVPACVTERVPAPHRGWVEGYVHHEVSGPMLLEKRRTDLDRERRSKRSNCRRCRYDGECAGVWNGYLERFGWEEFEPA